MLILEKAQLFHCRMLHNLLDPEHIIWNFALFNPSSDAVWDNRQDDSPSREINDVENGDLYLIFGSFDLSNGGTDDVVWEEVEFRMQGWVDNFDDFIAFGRYWVGDSLWEIAAHV